MTKAKSIGMITLAAMLISSLILPGVAAGDAPSNNPSEDRLVATYGGYGISKLALGDEMIFAWGTMGDVLVDITFRGDGAKGVIVLGDTKYKVELELTDDDLVADGTTIVHRSIEGGWLYEGTIVNYGGEVKLVRYRDVVVGEIDLGQVAYRFDVASSLHSAGTILVLHNDEYVERLQEMGILQLPELPRLTPPVEPDEVEELRFICPQIQYVPSLKELLAAGDDDIAFRLVTEPHRVEELRELSKLNEHVLTLVAGYTLSHIEEGKDIDEISALLRRIVTAEHTGTYLEELQQLIWPIGANPSWRTVTVIAYADEEFIALYGSPQYRSVMISRIELADNPFVSTFGIDFSVRYTGTWSSPDHSTLSWVFWWMRLVTSHWGNDVVIGFTNEDTPGCNALGMAELLGDDAIIKHHQWIVNILQHEFSHLFGATCDFMAGIDYHCDVHCIMGLGWPWTTGWCDPPTPGRCRDTIISNKWRTF